MSIEQTCKFLADVTTTLKPCPLCGSPAKAITYDFVTVEVACENLDCRCMVQRRFAVNDTFTRTVAAIVRAWNRRPKQTLFLS